jgi:hypothetical protein
MHRLPSINAPQIDDHPHIGIWNQRFNDFADGGSRVKAQIVAIVADGALSALGSDIQVTSEAVMQHMAQRLSFVDPGFAMETFTDKQLQVP